MTTVVTVAAQFAPSADCAKNQAFIAATVAAHPTARVLVFPEYSAWYDPRPAEWASAAQPLDGEFVTFLDDLVHGTDVVIVAGFIERDGSNLYNTVVAVSADGVLAHYRKVHLYDAFGQRESDWLGSGNPAADPAVFAIGDLTFGIHTCYDLRFPEASRRLVDAGASVLIVPSDWVPGDGKSLAWNTLTSARAIENVAYVVAANHAPPSGTGETRIVSPSGVAVELNAGESVVLCELDSTVVAAARERNPALELRRYTVSPR